MNGSRHSGPTYANEGFSRFNTLLVYRPEKRRMELITAFDLKAGVYEALVNYTIPGEPSPYWSPNRRARLPLATQRECVAYYPPRTRGATHSRSSLMRQRPLAPFTRTPQIPSNTLPLHTSPSPPRKRHCPSSQNDAPPPSHLRATLSDLPPHDSPFSPSSRTSSPVLEITESMVISPSHSHSPLSSQLGVR